MPSLPYVHWQVLWDNLVHFGAPDTYVSWLEKIIRPVVVYLLLVFALKSFGKRILAQLNPFDFVVLLTLSNTVQNAIIGNDTSLSGGILGAAALLGINACWSGCHTGARPRISSSRATGHVPGPGGSSCRSTDAPAAHQRGRAARQGARARVRFAERGRTASCSTPTARSI